MIFGKKQIDRKSARLAEAYLRVFTSEDGRLVLADLKRLYDSHSVWPNDPTAMAQLAGNQGVVKHVVGTMSLARAVRSGEIKIEEIIEEADGFL